MRYEKTHPHITFELNLRDAPPRFWTLLADAAAMCDAYSLALLNRDVDEEITGLAARRAAHSSAHIEGNTLTRRQVALLARGELSPPDMTTTQQHEVKNIMDAFELPPAAINAEWYKNLNASVMRNIPEKYGVPYGETRSISVRVGRFICPSADECDYLLARLFEWLRHLGRHLPKKLAPALKRNQALAAVILMALLAHLYAAWIHPFVDGNGRSARLLEYHMLANGGARKGGDLPHVRRMAAHELSRHYWETRDLEGGYYDQLEWSFAMQDDGVSFLAYALEGFVYGLGRDFGVLMNNESDRLREMIIVNKILEERE